MQTIHNVRNNRTDRWIILGLAILLLSGCAAHPRKTPKERQQVVKEDLQQAGYMVRFMLPYDQRQWFLRDLKHANFASGLSDYDAATTTIGLAAPKIGMALDIVGLLGPSGRMEYISKMYLPGQVEGHRLDTAEQARQFGAKYLKKAIARVAKQTGRTLRCVYQCEGYLPTYEWVKAGASAADKPVLFVSVVMREMKPATVDPLRDHILGFQPRWESKFENGWPLCVGEKVFRESDGSVETFEVEGVGRKAKSFCNSEFETPDEMLLLRTLTRDGYYVYGNTRGFQQIAAMNGRLFQVNGRRYNDFITYEILP